VLRQQSGDRALCPFRLTHFLIAGEFCGLFGERSRGTAEEIDDNREFGVVVFRQQRVHCGVQFAVEPVDLAQLRADRRRR
jgi:hypothetical protein